MSQSRSKECTCGNKQDIFCSKCSKIQMSILLKNGYDHLKFENYRGHKSNPVWYSTLKQNWKPEKYIIEGMLRRYFSSNLAGAANIIKFYENGTNNEVFSYTCN
jgi:hypothetical protein